MREGLDRAPGRDDPGERHAAVARVDAVGRRRRRARPVVEQLQGRHAATSTSRPIFSAAHARGPVDRDDRRQAEAAAHRDAGHGRSLRAAELPVRRRREARRRILHRGEAPDLLFVHFSDPDEYGHSHGWMSKEYLTRRANSERCLATVLAAIDGERGRRDHARDRHRRSRRPRLPPLRRPRVRDRSRHPVDRARPGRAARPGPRRDRSRPSTPPRPRSPRSACRRCLT